MAVVYSTTAENARLTAVRDLLNGGQLQIGTAGMASVLVTFTLDATSGSVASSVLTLAGFPKSVNASAGGTAAEARLRTSGNADVITGLTVGLTGSDINLNNLSIASGQQVTLDAAPTITHA